MPTAGTTHHIVLNGVGYMLRNGREGLAWKRSEVPYLVPRTAQGVERTSLTRPGGNNGGFIAGVGTKFGDGQYTFAHRVDGRLGDGLRVATQLGSTSGLTVQVNDFIDFNGAVWAATNSGANTRVYKLSGTAFSQIAGLSAGASVDRLVTFEPYLWCLGPNIAPFVINTADTPTATTGANSTDIDWMGRGGTWALALAEGGDASRLRWFATATGVSDTGGWNTIAENGDNWATVCGIIGLNDDIYVAKVDGLYQGSYNGTTSAALSRVLDFYPLINSGNFSVLEAWNDRLYFNIGPKLYRWDGSGAAEDVTPPVSVLNGAGRQVMGHAIKSVAAGNGWLWALTLSDAATPQVVLWAYNGDRWEMLYTLASHANAAAGALHYSRAREKLYINYYDGSSWAISSMDLRSTSDRPSASFNTSGNYIYLGPFDGGLPDLQKRFYSVVVRGKQMDSSNSVQVSYYDGASFTSLGTVTSNYGEVTFSGLGGLTGRDLWLRLQLNSDGTTTPCLEEVSVTYDLLPGPQKAIEFEVMLGPNLKLLDGTSESNSPTTLLAALDTARAAGTVVALSDPVVSATGGSAINVRLTEVEVRGIRYVPSGGEYGWIASVKAEVVT